MTQTSTPHKLRASIGVTTEIHAKDCPACIEIYGPYKVSR